jgi:hypothetical protein
MTYLLDADNNDITGNHLPTFSVALNMQAQTVQESLSW